MLRADLDAPRKQRYTVKRIFDRLLDEHGAVEVTYPMVRAYVAVRRPQMWIEAGRGPLNAFIPQTHMPINFPTGAPAPTRVTCGLT